MSDRKWQDGGEQRKRKKLVSKGKLISGHFVSTRSQPSSGLSLLFLYIEYSRFFVHHPVSNPADPIIVSWKDRQRPRLHRRTRQKGPRIALYAVLRNLECKWDSVLAILWKISSYPLNNDGRWESIKHHSLVLLWNFRRWSQRNQNSMR